MDITSKTFWKRTLELVLRGGAMGALLAVAPDTTEAMQTGTLNAFSVNWTTVAGYALGGMALSLLFSLAAKSSGDPASPTIM